jgi:phenylalanine-4-hydroxylase
MNWWTVEYGLIGDLRNPKIFGAGLLSSVGESRNCLTAAVKKIPLSIACTEQSYDITRPQPQLFVADDIPHLVAVLAELEETLSFRRGGLSAIEEAKRARAVTTTVFADTRLSVSGILKDASINGDRVEYLSWQGPVQLCHAEKELQGQGVAAHPEGFGSPVGKWLKANDKSPSQLTDSDLVALGLKVGSRCELAFVSGFVVQGALQKVTRIESKLKLLTWTDCTVARGSDVRYQPAWGVFDMLVTDGDVASVYGGPADRPSYGDHNQGKASTKPGRTSPFTEREKQVFGMYQIAQSLRSRVSRGENVQAQISQFVEQCQKDFRDQWLLRIESIELAFCAPQFFNAKALRLMERDVAIDAERFDSSLRMMILESFQLSDFA